MIGLGIKTAVLLALIAAPALCQTKTLRLAGPDFFGTTGIDLERVRASLPVHEGDEVSTDALPDLIPKISDSVKAAIGKEPTDVAPVCCDERGNWMTFVGLPGKNVSSFVYNPKPTGSVRLPQRLVDLYHRQMDLIFESVRQRATEDRTQGFALSS